MSRLIIKTGTIPNDRSGDSLFAAFNKVNTNFEELYNITGGSVESLQELIQDTVATMFANGTLYGININYNDPNNSIDFYNTNSPVDGGFASAVFSNSDIIFDGGDATTDTPTDMLINGGNA